MKLQVNSFMSYEEKWQEGMKDLEGKLPQRMVNDECEEDFWKRLITERKHKDVPDPYAKEIFKEISSLFSSEDHVLEIGPGWGNYTFPLAERTKQLTVVDSSLAVLEYLKDATKTRKLDNVEFLHEKWEEVKLEKNYDVVFGINCFYRMYEIKKALSLINQHANRLAVLGMTTGPIQPHYTKLHEHYGYDIKFPRRDYIDLLNLLYELGIYAECKIIPLKRTYQFSSYEELISKNASKILTATYKESDVEEALRDFVRFENGIYLYDHHYFGAIILWKPQK
ncbi:class I SAM-dependent methyltransferase [Halalkalibacter nanhaiisediminis]|uniref:Methyltransferase family protein n=1 Tax=Halalkalibacter nanhaiisediminis TaxID=688079 RepID=A0A562QQM0_9BACI|nr:class I SAM-dependent methyltransferase [Halalkalibacter nanhaiisediminis]TWI59007.1 methyltransferase family protein [Halalkalibacter nanhaiisediminis]